MRAFYPDVAWTVFGSLLKRDRFLDIFCRSFLELRFSPILAARRLLTH